MTGPFCIRFTWSDDKRNNLRRLSIGNKQDYELLIDQAPTKIRKMTSLHILNITDSLITCKLNMLPRQSSADAAYG